MRQTTCRFDKLAALLAPSLALLVFATSLYVRVRLLDTPMERDEGEYAYTARLLLQGFPPYLHAYTMKLPGVHLAYALFMAIFGQSVAAIRIGLMLVNVTCSGLVYLLGRRLFSTETAIIAAAFFALLSLSQSVLGIFAHATHLVVLFTLAGIILLGRALDKQQTPLIFMAGFCFGMAFIMKQHAALIIPFAIFFQIWPQQKEDKRLFLRNCFIYLTAAAVPYVVVLLWLFNAGVFDRFWFWTVQYASEYASGSSFSNGLVNFVTEFVPIAMRQLPQWLLAGAGIFILCKVAGNRNQRIFLFGYLVVSFMMTAPGLHFRPHYFILVLPAISILAAFAVSSINRTPGSHLPVHFRLILHSLVLVLASGYCFYAEKSYLFKLSPDEVSRRINGANPFPEAVRIGSYIKERTSAQDRIAILGSEPEILFYADRLSATGHIYMYGLMEGHKYAEEMQRQLISEIEASEPKFIVVVRTNASWKLREYSRNIIQLWGDSYIPLRYDEVGIVDIFGDRPTRYLWDDNTAGYEPESESFVSIFKRR